MDLPEHCIEPYGELSSRTKAAMQHDYLDAEGQLLWRIVRYANARGNLKERSFVPAQRGDWWVCKPRDGSLPEEDQRVDRYPLYRLPELLTATRVGKSRQVWVVDGERCVDAMLDMASPPASGPPPCTCLYGRKYNFQNFDLKPLRGQRVLLLAAASKASRDYMRKLAQELTHLDCQIRLALPPDDTGRDVADALAEGGWLQARAWLRDEVEVGDYVQPSPESSRRTRAEAAGTLPPLVDTEHFQVLGRCADCIVFYRKKSGIIKRVRATSLNRNATLLTLAPDYGWWLKTCALDDPKATLTSPLRDKIMSALERAAAEKGVFDYSTVRGCGANMEPDGSLVYNLGDRLLLQNGDVMNEEVAFDGAPRKCIYTRGFRIKLGDHPDATHWSRELYDRVCDCHWGSPSYARAFLGWMVAAVAGGALPRRPMLWLTGPISSDTTFFMEEVLMRLMEPLIVYLIPRTEADVPQFMGSDSLTLMLDEFELETNRKRRECQRAILNMTRSRHLHRPRARHRRKRTKQPDTFLRFNAVCASTRRPALPDEDLSHFFFVRLMQRPASDWPVVRQALKQALSSQRALAIRTWIIRNVPTVVRRAAALESELISHYNLTVGEAQMSAALTAGAELLSGDAEPVLREQGRLPVSS